METIIESNIVEEYRKDMTEYAIEVNRRRQVPDYRDGLKLVVRRILHTMFFDETRCRKSTVKDFWRSASPLYFSFVRILVTVVLLHFSLPLGDGIPRFSRCLQMPACVFPSRKSL